jgi:hypothetical protein
MKKPPAKAELITDTGSDAAQVAAPAAGKPAGKAITHTPAAQSFESDMTARQCIEYYYIPTTEGKSVLPSLLATLGQSKAKAAANTPAGKATTSADQGLFERWIAAERATTRSMGEILAALNAAAGTAYKHNWPSVQAARGFELERCPVAVRRYMMRVVMRAEFDLLGIDKKDIEYLIKCLT